MVDSIDLRRQEVIDFFTDKMLDLPQADAPVAHYFSPGLYIREVTFPAGIFVIGHKQRFEQLNVFLVGKIAMFNEKGECTELKAPCTFIGPPGAKMGYVIETTVWQNVYPNVDDEHNIDTLENRWLDKSGPWEIREDMKAQERKDNHQEDRDDFINALNEYGYTLEKMRAESERTDDLMLMPKGLESVLTVRNSSIEGKGLFLSYPFDEGVIIGPARMNGKRTPIGRYVNHSKNPNCELIEMHNGDVMLRTLRPISGCKGGDKGEEITIDYRDSIKIKMREKPCLVQLQQ